MPNLADRVKETTAAPGTGNVTLLGAATGYQSFNTAFPGGSVDITYCIADQSGPDWEIGLGMFISPSTLVRTKVYSSSNSNNPVNFSSGTQDVFVTVAAHHVEHASLGAISAMARGLAMP